MANTGEYRQDIILTIRTTGTTDWLGNSLSPSVVINQLDIRNSFGAYPQITDSQYAMLLDTDFIPRRDDLINTISGITSNEIELLKVTSTGYSGTLCPIPVPTTTTTTTTLPPPTTTTTTTAPLTTTTTTHAPTTTTTTTAPPPVNYTLNINVTGTEDIVVNTTTYHSYKRFYHLVMSPTPIAGHSIVLTYQPAVIGPQASFTIGGVPNAKVYGTDYTSNQYVSADGTNVQTGTVLVGTTGASSIHTFTFDTAHPTHELVMYADLTYAVPPVNYSTGAEAFIYNFISAVFASGSGNIAVKYAGISETLPLLYTTGAITQ
jgi:hypothetical protein